MCKQRVFKRITVCAAAAMLLAAVPSGSLSAQEGAMGRYVETELVLPEMKEGEMAYDIVRTQSGDLRMVTAGNGAPVTLWDSSDGGETWSEAASLPADYADAYYTTIELCADGGGAGIAAAQEEYYYVSFDAQGNARRTQQDDSIGAVLAFSRDGQAVQMVSGGLRLIDRVDGSVLTEFGDIGADGAGVCGDEAFAVTDDAVFRYRLSDGEPLPADTALEEALFAGGETYEINTSFGRPILFAQDEENRFYYCTSHGIFSHMMGGSVVEQIVDDGMTMLSSPSGSKVAFETADGSFYLLCLDTQGKSSLRKFSYSEDVESTPSDTVTVYSLEENDAVRQAALLYQQKYPEVHIDYRAALSDDDGMTQEDALRTLNTEILSGNAPDILILDGMPVEAYTEKGILTDLTDILEETDSREGLFENVAYAYRDGDVTYAVPSRFGMAAVAGTQEILEQADGVQALAELSGVQRQFTWSCGALIAESLYPVSSAGWKRSDGTLDEEKLLPYFEACRKIYEDGKADASAEVLEILEMYEQNMTQPLTTYYDQYPVSEAGLAMLRGECNITVGLLTKMYEYMQITSVNRETGNCKTALFGEGQDRVFIPYGTLGITSTAKSAGLAEDFVRYLLSAESMQGRSYTGFPVNMQAFEHLLYEEEMSDGVVFSGGDSETSLEYTWPEAEELEVLTQMAQEVNVCADMDSVQREAVLDAAHECMFGTISAQEAVSRVMQQMNLYLAERGGI